MTWRSLLLRAYPRSWRNEYGEELAAVLAMKRMTPGVVADVLRNGAKQHLYRDDPWKICGAGLTLWTLLLMLLAAGRFVTRPWFLWCYFAGQLFVFGAGAWTALQNRSGVWRATAASAKAALVPNGILILFTIVNLLRYWVRYGHSTSYWISKNIMITALLSFAFGIAGALFGGFFARLARG